MQKDHLKKMVFFLPRPGVFEHFMVVNLSNAAAYWPQFICKIAV
jgi:hypothetical protein